MTFSFLLSVWVSVVLGTLEGGLRIRVLKGVELWFIRVSVQERIVWGLGFGFFRARVRFGVYLMAMV